MDILFGEPQRNLRQTLRSVLCREGYDNIRDANALEDFEAALTEDLPDILIMDVDMGGHENPAELVRRMRHGEFGRNPYIPIILTVWEPTQETVKAVAASGADDILVKPLAPHVMLERIKALAFNRKKFFVASDYIGPDRRTKNHVDRGQEEIPAFDVPNTLKTKCLGESVNVKSLEQQIARSKNQINNLKLERNAFQMAFLVELILSDLNESLDRPVSSDRLENLFDVAQDTAARLQGSAYDHVADLCASMLSVTTSLMDEGARQSEKDLKLLRPLSEAILLACNPESDSLTLASKISGAINRFKTHTIH